MTHSNSVLFYPCCGSDLAEPMKFLDYIDIFWFVDFGSIPDIKLLQHTLQNWRLIHTRKQELAHLSDDWSSVCFQYKYQKIGSEKAVTINCVKGKGVTTMKRNIQNIKVFFYRGDSLGEGGSGTWWLSTSIFPKLIERLAFDGYIVTDGSNCTDHTPWGRRLRQFHRNDEIDLDEAVKLSKPFKAFGRRFMCVGNAGRRYGPTLIWESSSV